MRFILITRTPPPPTEATTFLPKGFGDLPHAFRLLFKSLRVNPNRAVHHGQSLERAEEPYICMATSWTATLRVHDEFVLLEQKHLSLLAPFVSARPRRAELCLGSRQWDL